MHWTLRQLILSVFLFCDSPQINGPTVEYLGTGDFHETQFNHMEMKSSVSDLDKYSIRGSAYTGIPVNEDVCPFTIRVYPSTTMEDEYLTSQPIVITCVVVLIFVCTSFFFVAYDVCVEKRQRLVMSSAVRSNAIVSSLFPSNVRDRLMDQALEQQTKSKKTQSNAFLTHTENDDYSDNDNKNSTPIADLFPEAVSRSNSRLYHVIVPGLVLHLPVPSWNTDNSLCRPCRIHSLGVQSRTYPGVYTLGNHLWGL